MVALTGGSDGDGVIDMYGYDSRWDFLVYNLIMSNGTVIAGSDKENLSSPEVAECLDFIYNMYNVDHVAKPWNSDDFDFNQNAYDNPELVYNVFYDWQNWYHGDTDLRDGDLTWWEDCAITEENYAVMEYMGQRGAFDLWNALGLEWDWSALLNGEMTAAQFQETYKQNVQDALDSFYK